MKRFAFLFLLSTNFVLANESALILESDQKLITEGMKIDRKNNINMNYKHGLAGISYQRNYYDYAAALISYGKRNDPNLEAFSFGLEWTTEKDTLTSGWYMMPSIVYYKTGKSKNVKFNDSYHKLYGVNMRENDAALGMSFILNHKWIFNTNAGSYAIGVGPEFIRLRSSYGIGFIANLGIIF